MGAVLLLGCGRAIRALLPTPRALGVQIVSRSKNRTEQRSAPCSSPGVLPDEGPALQDKPRTQRHGQGQQGRAGSSRDGRDGQPDICMGLWLVTPWAEATPRGEGLCPSDGNKWHWWHGKWNPHVPQIGGDLPMSTSPRPGWDHRGGLSSALTTPSLACLAFWDPLLTHPALRPHGGSKYMQPKRMGGAAGLRAAGVLSPPPHCPCSIPSSSQLVPQYSWPTAGPESREELFLCSHGSGTGQAGYVHRAIQPLRVRDKHQRPQHRPSTHACAQTVGCTGPLPGGVWEPDTPSPGTHPPTPGQRQGRVDSPSSRESAGAPPSGLAAGRRHAHSGHSCVCGDRPARGNGRSSGARTGLTQDAQTHRPG